MLPRGMLGFEWDADLDNGARPPGLFHLSSTTLPVNGSTLLLDAYGLFLAPASRRTI